MELPHIDPVTLDEIPYDDDRKDYLAPNWEEIEIRKRHNELYDDFAELERQIETGDVPKCCAGHWALFGCHRPHCKSEVK